jgi:hypothetical protein
MPRLDNATGKRERHNKHHGQGKDFSQFLLLPGFRGDPHGVAAISSNGKITLHGIPDELNHDGRLLR